VAQPAAAVRITISWEVTVLSVSTGELEVSSCQKCGAPLNLHQPDEDDPSHLLGTCGQCGTWHMIEVTSRGTKSLLYTLPDAELLRAKHEEAQKKARGGRQAPRGPQENGSRGAGEQVA
jgi:hypothetical protein